MVAHTYRSLALDHNQVVRRIRHQRGEASSQDRLGLVLGAYLIGNLDAA